MGWLNSDGLYIKFGQEEALVGSTGEYRTLGPTREVDAIIDLTKIGTTSGIIDYLAPLPKDGFIESVIIETKVAAVGGTSLSVGLVRSDYSTYVSETALVNALPTATFTAAGTRTILTAGSSGVGSAIGTKPGFPVLITAKVAGTFTNGVLSIRINWSK